MKKSNLFFVVILLSIFLTTSCKTDEELYAFPTSITIENKECLQTWEQLIFQSSNRGSKIFSYGVIAWFGINERDIVVNPLKYNYSSGGAGFKFVIDVRDLGDNNYIFVQLDRNTTDKGSISGSKIYKFKKTVTTNCIKWVAYE
jgi:hypothetical protein